MIKAITADVLADDEEYEEILEDMREECSKYGMQIYDNLTNDMFVQLIYL